MEELYIFTDDALEERNIDPDEAPICSVFAKTYEEEEGEVFILVAEDGRRFAASEDEIKPYEV